MSQINRRTLIQASGAAGLTMLTPGLARAATLPGRHDYGDIRDIEHTDLASYCLTVRASPIPVCSTSQAPRTAGGIPSRHSRDRNRYFPAKKILNRWRRWSLSCLDRRMTNVIEARGLVKRYGDLTAVDHVDITVPQGTFFGLLGPNGAGKTTTLEMIEGIREPDEGDVRLFGEKVWPRNRALLPRIGVQLQASAFFERLSVEEQLRCFADLYAVDHKQIDRMIEMVGLQEKRKTRTEDLSGGQKQRLSIACSLIHDPEVVFLDEPTAALDPQARRNLWDVLRAINDEGRTVVLTTHYMDEAEILCDQIAIIDRGQILTTDTPRNLITGLGSAYRILVSEGVLSDQEAAALPGVDSASLSDGTLAITTHTPSPVLAALAERDALQGLQVTGATLEDVFLTLTGREYRA